MFDLVVDVERYPEFLPWCTALRIRDRAVDHGIETLTADMVVAFKVFRERFGSRSIFDREALTISTSYLNGPFRDLNSNWVFESHDDGSTVSFNIDFEFRNVILQSTAAMFFEGAFLQMHDAFIERADHIYENTGSPAR